MIIARVLAAAAIAAGLTAWLFYLRADLVLSHYDAKAHLVVARRIMDNITPGWQQIGAVWLPLPHVLNAIPSQVDALYRTGAFASLVSIACLGVVVYVAARLIVLSTGSRSAAVIGAALLILNLNLLYLHVTPMTEPLLLASTFLVVLWLWEWVPQNQDGVPRRLGCAMFAGLWTRYEAWPITAVAIAAALLASARLGASRRSLVRRAWRLAAWPAAAAVLFIIMSRITVGEWLVTGGFYVPDPHYQHRAGRSLVAVWWGTHRLSTLTTVVIAAGSAALSIVRALVRRSDAPLLVPLALFGSMVVPFAAFYAGHPFRIRYMIPLVAASALFAGLVVGVMQRHAAAIVGALLLGASLLQAPPWHENAPMRLEAQWDAPASRERRAITACLATDYGGEKILASMGSLAHYMQELSHEGLAIRDFVHEGNGVIWKLALETGPAPHVGWMITDERSEGGDVLAHRIAQHPEFMRGMSRVCEGGGVALYRRD